MIKKCHRCNLDKDGIDFPKNSTHSDGKGSYCLSCQKLYVRAHYSNNKKQYMDRNIKRGIAAKSLIDSLKNSPCKDCGVNYPPYVMDFDHLDDKRIDVSRMKTYSDETIKEEIAKCDLVCANCHRIRTWSRSHKV